MIEHLRVAGAKLYDRKCAVFPDEPDGTFMAAAADREGIGQLEVAGVLLSGLDLSPRDALRAATGYVDSVLTAAALGGHVPDAASAIGSAWFEGFLMGAFYARELDRETETPPEANTGAIPSGRLVSVPSRSVVRRTLARVAARFRGQT